MSKTQIMSAVSNIKHQIVEEIHRPARINFKRRRVILKSLNDLFQADLVEMIPYSKENKGYKYILVVINCFSKFVWALPLKNKTGVEVSRMMEKILKKQTPKNLQTDAGLEFFNKDFKKLMQKYNINHYNVFSELKAAIVERVNRTLKGMMWKEFSYQGNYKWLSLLPKIVEIYNGKKHRTIGMKPKDVSKKDEKHLLETVYNHIKRVGSNRKFKIGDYVRISKLRGIFDKKFKPNWSYEIFRVKKVQLTNPITYLLSDDHDKDILGGFYAQQLQKVKYPEAFLVEKVIKRKGDKIFVKWMGFDNKHNSWIKKDKVV